MRCLTQWRPSDGAASATRLLKTRHVMRSDSRSAMHSWLRIKMCSSFGRRRSAARKGLAKVSTCQRRARRGWQTYLDGLGGDCSVHRMFLTPLSDAISLLAALRQLGRFLLMPFSATAAGSAVLALWLSGVWLRRRDFSIGTSVVLKKGYCAGRRL